MPLLRSAFHIDLGNKEKKKPKQNIAHSAFAQASRAQNVAGYLQTRFRYRERKCADTIGTVLVPEAGHFQC